MADDSDKYRADPKKTSIEMADTLPSASMPLAREKRVADSCVRPSTLTDKMPN